MTRLEKELIEEAIAESKRHGTQPKNEHDHNGCTCELCEKVREYQGFDYHCG